MSVLTRALGAPWPALDGLGKQAGFYGEAIGWVPKAVKGYKREQARLIAEVSMSNGALPRGPFLLLSAMPWPIPDAAPDSPPAGLWPP